MKMAQTSEYVLYQLAQAVTAGTESRIASSWVYGHSTARVIVP